MTRSFRVTIAICLGLILVLSGSVFALAGTSTGSAAFQQYCAACHGGNGQGTAYGPNIQGEGGDVHEMVREGGDGMPAFSPSVISDSTLGSIANYVSGLGNSGTAEYRGDDGHEGHDSASGSQYGGGHANGSTGDHHANNRHHQQRHEQDD